MAMLHSGRRLLLFRKSIKLNRRNNGYVVLLPEIGDIPEESQLLQDNGLPEFNNITIENCMASIAKQTLEFETGIRKIESEVLSKPVNIVKDVLEPLDTLGSSLELTWGISKTLYLGNNTLIPTKTYLAIHDRARRARTAKYKSIPIYETVKKELENKSDIKPEETAILNKLKLEGKLNGLDLDHNKKVKLATYYDKLAKEKQQFKQKIEHQTLKFSHTLQDYETVRDFPKSILQKIAVDSKNYLQGPWKATLQPNIYKQIMQYCPDREIRWNLWQAKVNRGSGYLDNERNTVRHLEEIRVARHEISKLLGYESFVDMSMETKMAGNLENVKSMLNSLYEYAKPAQTKELADLYTFAVDQGFQGEKLELWDVPYWRRKQEEVTVNCRNLDRELKQYFQLPKVLEGLFNLSQKLFGITIRKNKNVSTWHKNVEFYDIFEDHQNRPVAGFYLDPYSRGDDKIVNLNSIGWMVGMQNKSQICYKTPLASLIFNFDLPLDGKPSQLTFTEVSSLFNRFGLALQHLLTQTTYAEVAGLSNVEWDVVEVCGHVLSSFLQNEKIISSISSHSETKNKLPDEMLDNLVLVKNHMAGTDLCKELYLSELDLHLYSKRDYWLNIVKELWPKYCEFPLDKNDSHPCSFMPIVTEEWAAAYYSHIWSKVIAADVYSAFNEASHNGNEYQNVGKRFRDTFLALGGSAKSTQIFRQFRGRDPSSNALLHSLNLDGNKQT